MKFAGYRSAIWVMVHVLLVPSRGLGGPVLSLMFGLDLTLRAALRASIRGHLIFLGRNVYVASFIFNLNRSCCPSQNTALLPSAMYRDAEVVAQN